MSLQYQPFILAYILNVLIYLGDSMLLTLVINV